MNECGHAAKYTDFYSLPHTHNLFKKPFNQQNKQLIHTVTPKKRIFLTEKAQKSWIKVVSPSALHSFYLEDSEKDLVNVSQKLKNTEEFRTKIFLEEVSAGERSRLRLCSIYNFLKWLFYTRNDSKEHCLSWISSSLIWLKCQSMKILHRRSTALCYHG